MSPASIGSLLVTAIKVKPPGPDRESDTSTAAFTVTILWFGGHRTFGLTLQVTAGGVLSIFTAGEVNVAVFPARSASVTVCVTPLPSVVRTSGLDGVVAASPENLSAAANAIETLPLFQPAPFGKGLGELKVTVGAVLSIRTVSVFGVSWFPALSTAKYVRMVMPSAEIVIEVLLPAIDPSPA